MLYLWTNSSFRNSFNNLLLKKWKVRPYYVCRTNSSSKKFQCFEWIKDFSNEIKILFFFKDSTHKSNVLIVTSDDKVFVFGPDDGGVLGFGDDYNVKELTLNEELSYKQLIDFKHSLCHAIARTIDGEVYCWGYNENGVLGNGRNDSLIYKPEVNQYLIDKQIIDICCGSRHTLVLTDCGEVYAWGCNEFGQIGNERSGKMNVN
jgi:alpha-tubulin suppressor-like RCC1 family protein